METALRALMASLGGVSILIASSILLLGAGPTVNLGFAMFDTTIASRALWSPDADSEIRFYAALFLAFGILAVRAARDPYAPESATPWLALVFFLGGIGRLLSLVLVGAPHPFLLVLMAMELAMPLFVYLLLLGGHRHHRHSHLAGSR